jgi:hypothetical protein
MCRTRERSGVVRNTLDRPASPWTHTELTEERGGLRTTQVGSPRKHCLIGFPSRLSNKDRKTNFPNFV